MAKKHRILWIAGAGIGAWVAYEYVYKPWAAASAAAQAAGGQAPSIFSSLPSILAPPVPSPAAMLSTPLAITPSNLNPGALVGGAVGACMAKKGGTWTQQQCQTRLDALSAAANNAQLAISQLRANTTNPAVSGIPATQAQIALEQAALNVATTNYNAAVAANNTNDAATWHAAMIGHQNDINELNALIASVSQPVDNSAAIAAYQGQLAANDNDYFALTGSHLISG